MRKSTKYAFIILIMFAFVVGSLSLAAPGKPHPETGPKPKYWNKCPWPACTEQCDPDAGPLVPCKEKVNGEVWWTTQSCCCCNENAKHRYLGTPK